MKNLNQQGGFTYLEVMISIILLTVGITAQLSALSLSMIRAKSTEQRNVARQLTSSTLESIFSARDIGNSTGLSNWDAINTKDVDSTNGIFEAGWRPVRVDSGIDRIHGTADDACDSAGACTEGTYTNNSEIMGGVQRKIEITGIPEPGVTQIRKKRITVKVRYLIGQLQTVEELSTNIADLPFYK